MRIITLILLLIITCRPALTWGQEVDSVVYGDSTTEFRPQQLIIPTALITLGAIGLSENGYKDATRCLSQDIAEMRGDNYCHIDDYFQYLPAVAYLGLDFIGAKARHSFTDRLLVTATSAVALGAMVYGTKQLVYSPRPDGSDNNSFPSGHTAKAFMGAELVRAEYGIGYGIGAYAVACGVGFMRVWNNRHWANDVLAGAGIGILSARIGYWMLPVWKKLFHLENSRTSVAITPYYNNNTFGASMAMVF